MADTVGEFLIKLGLDADNIDKQLNNVIGNVRSGLTNLMTGVVAPALAGLASGELVQQFADDITQVDKLSKSLGMSVEQLSAWRTAAEMAGVEANEVGEIFADFNDWMVDAKFNEGGAMYTDFIQNGLLPAVTDANGEMKKTEDYILEFADALHKMDPAQASGIARQIGLSDLQTASWIQQGGDAIRRQLKLAKEIGTYTQEDAQAASEFTMSIKILTHSVRMMLLPVFRALVPILTNVSKLFTEASKHATALIPVLSGIGIAVGVRMAGGFLAVAKSIKTAALAARAFIFSPWGAVLMALLAIGLVLEDFLVWLDGGESAWGEYYEKIFGSTENAKKIISNFVDTVTNEVEFLSNFIKEHWDFIKWGAGLIAGSSIVINIFRAISKAIKAISETKAFQILSKSIVRLIGFLFRFRQTLTIVSVAMRLLGASMGPLGLALTIIIPLVIEHWDELKEYFSNFADGISAISDQLGVIWNILGEIVDSVCANISEAITAAGDTINTIFTAVGNTITQIGNVIQMIFNAMANAFNTFVSAVSSGASTIIGWITNILNKLAELASNSLLGKVLGSVGGSISAFIGGGSGSTDNSSTTINVTNYGVKGASDIDANGWIPKLVPESAGAY